MNKVEDFKYENTTDPPEISETNEKEVLLTYISELELKLSRRQEARTKNQNAIVRPAESHFTKLDSNLKKNTTFIKKIRNFDGNQLDSYLKDMSTLNLSKYISEVASAIVEAKIKMSDIAAAVKLCSDLHQLYSDFSSSLFENWQKCITVKAGDKIANPSKFRVDLRFYAELLLCGVFQTRNALSLLGNVLLVLINMDKEDPCNCSIILSFCKHCGEEYAGVVPRRIRLLVDKFGLSIPRSTFLPIEKQHNVKSLLRDYYLTLCRHLASYHAEIQSFDRQNERILQTKGELSHERKEKLESLQILHDKLLGVTKNFAEILDEEMPSLKTQNPTSTEQNIVVTGAGTDIEDYLANLEAWCDIETQKFYCDLPELQAYLPTSFLNKASPIANLPENSSAVTEEVLDSEFSIDDLDDDGNDILTADDTRHLADDEAEDSASTANTASKSVLESFMANLPNCINRELIDNAAIDFLLTLNTKYNRKKIVKALFGVNRTRLDLLPFYARFVAILQPAVPEVATDLCTMLRQDFKYHVRKKDQINIESKIKVVRFIGELVKFNVYAKLEALYCLKVLLNDFSHHHIEMACNLLEICGRYLYCSQDSHQRTRVYLDQMMRKKAVMALDSRYVTQIENTYYHVNPPETVATLKKERPVMHQFIRKLLYQDLHKTNIDKILKLMRKLPWQDEETCSYAIKCLSAAYHVKYFNVRCLANLLAGLVAYQEEVGTKVVDNVLEDIRLGMEVNLPKYNQRRVAQIRYLGELYNYRMIESSDVFKVLYSLISFGVSMKFGSSTLDPPSHIFRIRLACVLLSTCGTYFSSGSSRKKLDYFLKFFQAYYWYKKSMWKDAFPYTLDHIYKETILMLRPKFKFVDGYEEAKTDIVNLRSSLSIDKLLSGKTVEWKDPDSSRLEPIKEADDGVSEQTEECSFQKLSTNMPLTDDTVTDEDTHDSDDPEIHDDIDEDDLEKDDPEKDPEHDYNDDRYEYEDYDEDDDDGTASDGGEVIPLGGPKRLACAEDDAFLNAFDRMVSENIQERMREPLKAGIVDISVPLLTKSHKKHTTTDAIIPKLHTESIAENSDCINSSTATHQDQGKISFVLMTRKGSKQQYKSFEADMDSELVQNFRDQSLAQKEEKEKVKRLTLNITERLEEEDYNDMLQQQSRPAQQNFNRERKKYQHPKGVPDADLIFGPKRVR